MSDKEIINISALVVCTLNRPTFLARLLHQIETQSFIPALVVVVDSSLNDESEQLVSQISASFPTCLVYIKSLSGLPHQRNVGIRYTLASEKHAMIQILSFLDDDVIIPNNYFRKVVDIFSEVPEAICVGGYVPKSSITNNASFARRSLQLGSLNSGVVLKSGIAIPCNPSSRISICDWVPGGMQNISKIVFKHELFDGRVRMYGEDLEFQLRIRKYGLILCSIDLPILHLEASISKEDLRSAYAYTDGFRWTLAIRCVGGVQKSAVLFSTFALTIGELILWILHRNDSNKLSFLGHVDFIKRLILKRQVQQLVDHVGSGPLAENQSN